MINKFAEFINNHSKAFLVVALTCVLVIITSVVMAAPRIKSVIECEEVIESIGGREAIASNTSSSANSNDGDVFENANNTSNTKETTYVDTDEYKTKQNEITKMAERYADLNENKLMENLSQKTAKYFTEYSEYMSSPTPAKLEALKEYTTTEYFENVLKKQSPDNMYYLVADVRFADFDKDKIQSLVIMRGGDIKFACTYVKDSARGYLISGVRSIDL